MAKTSTSTTPDSLIDVLAEQVAREEAMLEQIREAHCRGDAENVMKLLKEFFTGSVANKQDHDRQS